MFNLFDMSDTEKTIIVTDSGLFKVVERCNRGYEPYYTLHKRKSLMWVTWWSGTYKCGEVEDIMNFVRRYEKWPEYDGGYSGSL
jgi:hypothetical protein